MSQSLHNKVRIDKYLWSIRIFKTRSMAASFCASGKISCNGNQVKASHHVKEGERYNIRMNKDLTRIVEVLEVISVRRSYEEIKHAYIDLTQWPEKKELLTDAFSFPGDSKNQRPTKKARRAMDNFFGKY